MTERAFGTNAAAELDLAVGRNFFIVKADGSSYLVGIVGIVEDPNLGRRLLCNPKALVAMTGRRSEFFKKGKTNNMEIEHETPGGIAEAAVVDWSIWPHDIPDTT